MPRYQAVFVKVDGLSAIDVGNPHYLNATTRGEAEDEAMGLPRPDGANFIKLVRDNFTEGEMLGLPF